MRKTLIIFSTLVLISTAGFSQTSKIDAKAFETRFSKATEFYFKGDYKSCIQVYDNVIKEVPDYLIAYYNRGLAKFYAGDIGGAKGDMEFIIGKVANSQTYIPGEGIINDAKAFLTRNNDKFSGVKSIPVVTSAKTQSSDASTSRTRELAMADAENLNEAETIKKLTANKWQYRRVEENGEMFSASPDEIGLELYFKKDGSAIMTAPKENAETGNWKYNHGTRQMSLTIQNAETTEWIVKFSVLGNLKLVHKKEGFAMVYDKVNP